ncbi:hypothetical protein [Erwinia sp. HR93]|uniref:hypothetical protein n=1 Tax=Erwinia sp. HR93 TaxID=3094840 RepID=UPI002ADED6CB|nr:hypothetical protein [Erwinia sp. HR93]MEA1065162.1 hypothetical protein [Erwinia sp. HR93]
MDKHLCGSVYAFTDSGVGVGGIVEQGKAEFCRNTYSNNRRTRLAALRYKETLARGIKRGEIIFLYIEWIEYVNKKPAEAGFFKGLIL